MMVYERFAVLADRRDQLVEQRVQHALEVASHAFVIERKGLTRLDGPAAELTEDRHLRKAYLGT